MARISLGGKIELAILALTLAVQVVKLVREHRMKKDVITIKKRNEVDP